MFPQDATKEKTMGGFFKQLSRRERKFFLAVQIVVLAGALVALVVINGG